MLRVVLLVLLLLVVIRLVRALLQPPRPVGPGTARPRAGGRRGAPERLVEDPECGLRVPESRAVRDGDLFFCSNACRDRHRAR